MTTLVDVKHHPVYYRARGQCWAYCMCGWHTNARINGNQVWAQLQFAQHLVDARRR